MKLVFVIKSLSTLGGGAERVFAEVVNGLHQRGHDVAVMTFESVSAQSFYRLDESVRRIDIGARGSGKLDQLALLPAARRAIVAASPDLVVAFMPSSYVPLAAALALSGMPLVASEHNVPERYGRQPGRWLSMLMSSALVRRFTAVSVQMQQAYPALIRKKMAVLPNPVTVDPDLQADVLGNHPEGGLIVSVGRLHKQKDHLTMIRAFALLAADFPGWRVRILGDGDERGSLEAEIARLGLAGRITLAGTVQNISAEYGAAQLYAVPSRYESFGLATVEAIAHGLPAIGFADCPGTNEIIKHGVNGVLVRAGADRAGPFATALRELMADPERRLALSSRVQDAGPHALGVVLDQWEQFLRDVAGK